LCSRRPRRCGRTFCCSRSRGSQPHGFSGRVPWRLPAHPEPSRRQSRAMHAGTGAGLASAGRLSCRRHSRRGRRLHRHAPGSPRTSQRCVLPAVPIRHWICSLPWGLRALLGYDRVLCSEVVSAFVGEPAGRARVRTTRPSRAHRAARPSSRCRSPADCFLYAEAAVPSTPTRFGRGALLSCWRGRSAFSGRRRRSTARARPTSVPMPPHSASRPASRSQSSRRSPVPNHRSGPRGHPRLPAPGCQATGQDDEIAAWIVLP
jgi:hypothetical protein